MANRIHAKGPFRHEENKANSALIYPGYLLAVDSNNEVAPHASEGGIAEALFAEEDALQGRNVATLYDDDSIVSCILPHKGSVIRAMIEDGQIINIGDVLMSKGNGKLTKIRDLDSGSPANDEYPIAVAEEAVALTGSGSVDTLCMVRIL